MKRSKERSKQEKPKYESPVIIQLGKQAVGAGTGTCTPAGPTATGTCTGPGGGKPSARRYKENIRLWV